MTRKERFKQWMEKDTLSDILAPIFAGYDLKQCVELKNKITRHENKVSIIAVFPAFIFIVIWALYMLISKWLAELGVIAVCKPDTGACILLIYPLLIIFCYAGYCIFTGAIKTKLNKRIEAIAGVHDGKEKESNNTE